MSSSLNFALPSAFAATWNLPGFFLRLQYCKQPSSTPLAPLSPRHVTEIPRLVVKMRLLTQLWPGETLRHWVENVCDGPNAMQGEPSGL
eukprot:CAMPEP_0181461346 /NCGR_PEP_ID=MMETSP1110-20121109/33833_1 /TAXON_ID=174948 /ORGANISM="Symbiodinium sp., Strain CCMP421" /LENGTH=88 /DNA_ID=CAMNT_0023585973 /DNA_START=34 /DNA_END=300 /DNA_ORIENTATION=-